MASSKLHLKCTPAEEAEREWRRAKKTAKKRRHALNEDTTDNQRTKRRHADTPHEHTRNAQKQPQNEYVFDSEEEYGPPPPPAASSSHSHRAYKPDYDEIYAQMENERFREKMWGALEDDERLDGVESRFNAYAHVPRRWRGGGMDRMDDETNIDPQMMDGEEYAEWIRAGMWRRKHAAEYAEQARKEADRAARRKREKAVREETARLDKAAEEERRRRRRAKEHKREADTRSQYDVQWKRLLSASESLDQPLTFSDVPWPIMRASDVVSLEDFTPQAISAFLLPAQGHTENLDAEAAKKERKDRLRETMLRFHPDKFEGRIMGRVVEAERAKVKEAVGVVVRIISELMGGSK